MFNNTATSEVVNDLYTPAPVAASTPKQLANAKRYAKVQLSANMVFVATVATNPRRVPAPGKGVGYHCMQRLIAAGPVGLTWAQYQAMGGRPEDIKWDLLRGWAAIQ